MMKKITNEEIINDIKRVSSLLCKVPVSQPDYKQNGVYSHSTITSRKSWNEWQQEIFGRSNSTRSNRKAITDEDLIENLIEMKEKLKRVPLKIDLSLENGSLYSANAYRRAFGNISQALLAAGLKPHQIRGASKTDILNDIKKVYDKLGYTPELREYENMGKIGCSFPTIKKHFGSWTKALLEANVPVEKAGKVAKEDVVVALLKWYNDNNQKTDCLEYWKIRKARQKRIFPYTCETISKKFNFIAWEDIMKQIDPKYETKDQFVSRAKFLGNDGNEYLSSIEKQVADILFDLKKAGKIEKYDYEVPVAPNKSWTCDFLINDSVWLEVDGMRNNRKDPYNAGNEKIQYYKNNKMNYKIVSYSSTNIKRKMEEIINENIVC